MKEDSQIKKFGKDGIEKYKELIAKLKKALGRYTIFGNEKMDLLKSLKTTREFLKNHTKDDMALVDLYDDLNVFYDPNGVEIKGDIEETIKVIESTIKKVTEQTNSLRKKIKEYEILMDRYNNMKNYPYELQSILMHSGDANGGHYYVFIRDIEKDTWRKYNDTIVTDVPEKKVFEEAVGSSLNPASAYFLIYSAKSHIQNEISRIKNFAISGKRLPKFGESDIMNYYCSLIPKTLMQDIIEENVNENLDVMNAKSLILSNEIINAYNLRHRKLLSNKRLKQYPEWNFISYLESQGSQYYRYALLDTIIREINEDSLSLDTINEYCPFFKVLNKSLETQCEAPPISLQLSHKENLDRKSVV